MRKWLLIVLFIFVANSASAQKSAVKRAQDNFEKAQVLLKQDQFDAAVSSLEETIKYDPEFQYAYVQLGDLNRRLKEFQKRSQLI